MQADDDFATVEEVREAIERLTDADLLRLRKFARWRMSSLGALIRGRDHGDLLEEAIAATLEPGRRAWRKGTVDFLYHLRMTMQSISDGWKTRKDADQILETEMHPADPDEHLEDPLGTAAVGAAEAREDGSRKDDQENRLISNQALDSLRQAVADDAVASEVFDGMCAGLNGPDIKEILGLSEGELQSARRKITRHAASLATRFGPRADRREE